MLKFEPSIGLFTYDENHPLPNYFLILDEACMSDISLAHAFLCALPKETHILWLGDTYQHPWFGEGNVLHNCIQSHYFHVTSLHNNFHQEKSSSIVRCTTF